LPNLSTSAERKKPHPLSLAFSVKKTLTSVTHEVTDKTVMIKSFKHKGLEDFFYTGSKRGIKPEHANRLERILDRLNAASEIRDMNYPGSFLH